MLGLFLISLGITVLGLVSTVVVTIFAAKKEIKRQAESGPPPKNRRPQIVEVRYIGPGSTYVKRGGVKGAFLGGFLAGDVGAFLGSAMPVEERLYHRFAVRYDNGRQKIVECLEGSARYEELMNRINWFE